MNCCEAAQRVTSARAQAHHVVTTTLTAHSSSCHLRDTKRYSYEFTEKHKAETMPKKRFLGNRSFKIMGGAPQCFNAPDGARGARPMSLRSGNQSQWRVLALVLMRGMSLKTMKRATGGQLAPVRP